MLKQTNLESKRNLNYLVESQDYFPLNIKICNLQIIKMELKILFLKISRDSG